MGNSAERYRNDPVYRQKILDQNREWRKKNKELLKERRAADPEKNRRWRKQWNDANPEKVKEMERRKYAKHRDQLLVKAKEWRKANPERKQEQSKKHYQAHKKDYRDSYLRNTYGISQEDYEHMFEEQGGVCAICEKPPKPKRPLAVDHDHKNAHVRGLLCDACNSLVAYLENTPDHILGRAFEYLDYWRDV